MKKCTKCGEDKPIDQYERYFHSTQGVYRTRGYCNPCMRKQKREWRKRVKEEKIIQPVSDIKEIEVIPEVIEIVPKVIINLKVEKECNTCFTVRPLEHFYNKKGRGNKYSKMSMCRYCYSDKYRKENIREPRSDEKVKERPNLYWNEFQRQDTFELMTLLGWKFNEENGKWWKEGLKDSDGQFITLRKRAKERCNQIREGCFLTNK